LLNYVEQLGRNTGFWRNNGRRIGSSNIRNLAAMATNADCYKEFRLFIEYKKGKGNGWDERFEGNKLFGDVILGYMDEIYEKCKKDDKEALKHIGKFFGYLYWKLKALER